MPGQVLGTIDYMAPELLEGVRIGPATDIYALACLAVETLTGQVPFLRDNDAATTYAHVMGAPPSVSERRPELPVALDDVIAAGMAKAPDDRPASAGTLIADMLRGAGPAAARRAGRDRLRRASRRCRRRRSRPSRSRGEAFDGRYEVIAPISSGAMGAVYRALDREEGREVAVKRLLDVRHAARFEIEARLLASLSHPRAGQGPRPRQRRAGRLHRHGARQGHRPRRAAQARRRSRA